MICVDELTKVLKVTGYWKWPTSCHLYSDDNNVSELHDFAGELGLKLSWFQSDVILPHYDLNAGMRKRAVARGAKETTYREMGLIMKNNRARIRLKA